MAAQRQVTRKGKLSISLHPFFCFTQVMRKTLKTKMKHKPPTTFFINERLKKRILLSKRRQRAAAPAIRTGCSLNKSQPYVLTPVWAQAPLLPPIASLPKLIMFSALQSLKTGHKNSIPQVQVAPGYIRVCFLLFPTVHDF